jgi:hypothetical protein
LLETGRALQAGPPLRNDVVFVFTDGEELGMAGARAFVGGHPWAKEAGIVVNFEARGSTGPSTLFETINGDRWPVDQFDRVEHANGSSLLPAIYRLMPNDTDLSAFKSTRVPGLNFAFAEKWSNYHSPRDSVEAIDPRSIQHHGEYALALANRFGNLDLNVVPSGNATFFNFAGWMVAYPEARAPFITGIAVLFLVAGIFAGFRKKLLTVRGLLASFIVTAVSAAAAGFLITLLLRVADGYIRQSAAFFESESYGAGVVLLALAVAGFCYSVLSNRTSFANVHYGALMCWALLGATTTILMPGASYVFTWSLIAGVAMSYFLFSKGGIREGSGRWLAVAGVASVPILLLVTPIVQQILIASARRFGFIAAALTALGMGLLLPCYRLIASRRRYLAPAVLGAAGLILIGGTISVAKPSQAYPKDDHVFYLANLDRGSAAWATLEKKEDAWTSQFFGGEGAIGQLAEFCPDWLYPGATILKRDAQKVEMEPPTVEVVSDEPNHGERRRLKLRISSPSRSPEVSVFVESDAELGDATLDGAGLQNGGAQTAFKQWTGGETGTSRRPQLSLRCYGIPEGGANLTLDTRAGSTVTIHLFERRYNLPGVPGLEIAPRGPGFAQARVGDATIAYRSFRF